MGEHLLLKSLEQENNHGRSPCNQQHQQNFSYHYNLHHQGQHYQHQQFGRQYQHKKNRGRLTNNDSYSQSHSQSHYYNYSHIHNKYTNEEQNDQLEKTTVSTVSFSTEEMDPFNEIDIFDGCDDGNENSNSAFDDIYINGDIDIGIDIDIDAANAVADCDNNNNNNNNFVTPTRKKEQPPPSSVFLSLKSSNLKQDEGETTNKKNNDDHTTSNPLLGQKQHEIKLNPSSPSSLSQKQSIAKINNNMNDKGKKKTKHNNEDKLVDSIVRVKFPTECDILCGQSRICASHVGNKRFQAVLDTYTARYDKATSKQEKMMTTKEIVGYIHNLGGRFLKFKNNDGMWEEISNVAARDKVSHALRTKAASWKRHQHQQLLQEEDGNNDSCGGGVSRSNGGRRSSMPNGLRRQQKKGGGRRQGSCSLSITSNTSDGAVLNDLMKAQREIFATLTTSSPVVVVAVAAAATTNNNNDHNHNHVIEPIPLYDKNRPESYIPCRRSSSYF